MSNLICDDVRTRFDKYTTVKSVGEFLMAAALMADDIKQLYDMIRAGEGITNYYWAIIAVLAASLGLQLVCIILSVILITHHYPNTRQIVPVDADTELGAVNDNFKSSDLTIMREQENFDPETPQSMKQMNDALTAMTLLVAALHVARNVLQGDIPGATNPPTTAAPAFMFD